MSDTFGPLFETSSPHADLQSSLESRLRHRLAGLGSPEYVLTWKHWDIASGPRICALRASRRRTSGNASSGWPTPQSRDVKGVDQKACLGVQNNSLPNLVDGWATPASADSVGTTGGGQGRSLRTDTHGLSAPTGGKGALNPDFVRWLMGYPPAWDACAPTATPSSRNSAPPSSKHTGGQDET